MFHGTSDLVVPYDSGLPFTINIALPVVYGSNQIHDRLNLFNIENDAFIESGEPHEYWGTLNGNWFGGPNENYTQIINEAYMFLYNQLDSQELGDINLDGFINIVDVVATINIILDDDYNIIIDMNQDDSIDILDVVLIIDVILN